MREEEDVAAKKTGKVPVSVIVLTKNEEANLPGCLESLRFADQVVVVDSQSTDRTLAVARRGGAQVFTRPWPGFTAQRNFAVSKCRHDWVLSVDADERVDACLAREIGRLMEAGPDCDGYRVPEVNLYCGRWLRRAGIYPSTHLILFNRRRGRFESARADVHEKVEVARVGFLKGHLVHWAYPNAELLMEKLNRYTDLEARGRLEKGVRSGLYGFCWRPFYRFLRNYFLKLGFLDGLPGLIYCFQYSFYAFLTECKLWEAGLRG